MIDIMSVAVGLICGFGVGWIAGRISPLTEIRHYQTDIFVKDKLLEAAQDKLRRLTERDERGRFTGGK